MKYDPTYQISVCILEEISLVLRKETLGDRSQQMNRLEAL